MNRITGAVMMAGLMSLSVTSLMGQESREQAVAGRRKVDAKEMYPSYTEPAPFAQKLADEALAKHPEVIVIAIHAQPPGHKNLIVASNFGRIGKIGDEDDLHCIRTGKSSLEFNSTGKHFEDERVLQDKAGDDKAAMAKIADQVRDEMKVKLPSKSALFTK